MGRPIKEGITYFSFDVDIFEDEKVVPISSEFGAKGECVLIRVLCAIYRNGYFAECSEAFKFKIANQAKVPQNLVSEVISGLVKWGFFDKSVFDSFGVLTSRRIQKNWKEATRKRVPKNEFNYWLLGGKNEFLPPETPFLPPETPLTPSESTQSKVKESKVNKKREREETPPVENPIFERIKNRFDIPLLECKKLFLEDQQHLEILSMNFNLKDIEITKSLVNDFFVKLQSDGITEKSVQDAKKHFSNWYNKLKSNTKITEKQVYD